MYQRWCYNSRQWSPSWDLSVERDTVGFTFDGLKVKLLRSTARFYTSRWWTRWPLLVRANGSWLFNCTANCWPIPAAHFLSHGNLHQFHHFIIFDILSIFYFIQIPGWIGLDLNQIWLSAIMVQPFTVQVKVSLFYQLLKLNWNRWNRWNILILLSIRNFDNLIINSLNHYNKHILLHTFHNFNHLIIVITHYYNNLIINW